MRRDTRDPGSGRYTYPLGYDLGARLVGQSGATYALTAPADEQRSRAGWWAALFVVLLGVLGAVVFFIGQNANWWGTPAAIKVPYLKGDPESHDRAILSDQGL